MEAKAPGYQPGRRQITAAPGEDKVLEWELVPETVTLEVITEPPGMIYVNGNLEGRAPREIADLPRTAPVKLRLTLPGHETIEETVKLDGPDPVKVKRLFVKSEGNR